MAALLYPELAPLAGGNVVIGHVVACYGAADRYLGMLAAVLGDFASAPSATSRRRWRSTAGWAPDLARPHRLRVRAHAARARRRGRERAAALLGRGGRRSASGSAWPRCAAGSPRSGRPTPRPSLPDGLSFREVQILGLVAEGLSNREIGSALFISEHTAANHIRSILRKTRCANRTEAATYAHRHGLVVA